MKDRFRTEVEEEADFQTGAAEIVMQLPGGGRVQFVGGFRLDDELVVDYEIEALSSNLKAFVHHRDILFTANVVSTIQQLVFQRSYVNMFEKAKAQRIVYLKERSNSRVSE